MMMKSETFILERAGKAIAMLTPISRTNSENQDGVCVKMNDLKQLSGIAAMDTRSNEQDLLLGDVRA